MKILFIETEKYVDVIIRDEHGINQAAYTFNNKQEAKAFVQGFSCCRNIMNKLVQDLPTTYTVAP